MTVAQRFPDPQVLALIVELDRTDAAPSSIGQAARTLHIAQPNASRMLASFEKDIGIPILERSPRGSTLTAQGKAVAVWATEVLAGYEHLGVGLAAMRAEISARLRICASMTVAEYLLPGWLERYRAHHAEVEVGLSVANSAGVIEAVRNSRCDLGFIETVPRPRGVSSLVIGRDALLIVATPALARTVLAGRETLTGADLADISLLVRETGSGTRGVIDRALAHHGGVCIAAELNSNAAVKIAASAGMAPAALSHRAVADALQAGTLVPLPVAADVELDRPLRVVWPAERRLKGPGADFVELAAQVVS